MQDVASEVLLGTMILGEDVDLEKPTHDVFGSLEKPVAEGNEGFVEVHFEYGQSPLGLMLDWSMPYPVISKVMPHSAASKKPQLIAGMVIIAINKVGLRIRMPRDEVEAKCRMRPLHLILEAPAPERFDAFHTMKAHKRILNRARVKLPKLGDKAGMSTSMASFMGGSQGSGLHNLQSSLTRSRTNFNSAPAERVPGFEEMRNLVKFPLVIPGGNKQQLSLTMTSAFSKLEDPGKPKKSFYDRPKTPPIYIPPPDVAYQHLVDEPKTVGPGPAENWPLRHDDSYTCKLSDMMLAWKLHEAYEVGFRGFKAERPTQMHLTCAKGCIPLVKKVARVDEVFCDSCGSDIEVEKDAFNALNEFDPMASLLAEQPKIVKKGKNPYAEPDLPGFVKESLGAFYFCRRCKRGSKRFELCAACHAVEVVQSEGKHYGKSLHPHYLRCKHRNLVEKKFVSDAVPGMCHIRRVMCDYCGHTAGAHDSDNDIWICPTCPAEHGLRFELCTKCYESMMTTTEGLEMICNPH